MYDVAIVGGGPVGLLAANLLGQHGLSVVVLEQGLAPYPLPRAVHIDHEVMRLLQSSGLAEAAMPMMRAAQGHLHIGADGEILRYLGTAGQVSRFGWPADLFFYQPELEALLRTGLDRFDRVELRLGVVVTGVAQTADSVTLSTVTGDGQDAVTARYVIACDGAASVTRKALSIALLDLDFEEPWLVVDIETDTPIAFPPYAGLPAGADLQHLSVMMCDPARPATIVPGRRRHRRWEFMLLPGEDDEAMRAPDIVTGLLAPWVGDAPYDLIRATTYRFHGLIAERWKVGRIFLAGDAAHQTPPFFGQGLCHGARDVANLAWKIAMVAKGDTSPALLDGYQAEREPQVRAVIATAVETGRYICELDPVAAAARDVAIRARELAGAPRTAAELIRPIGGLVRTGDAAAGARFIQPFIERDGKRVLLDDVTGGGPRLLLRNTPDLPAEVTTAFAHNGGSVWQGSDPALVEWFDEHGVDTVLVRPDFYVFGTAQHADAPALVSDWLASIPPPSGSDSATGCMAEIAALPAAPYTRPMTESAASRPAQPRVGRREQNKADKLRRITQSARALFADKGFDGTTMRDIATHAEVGFGTLFDYASDKRDLLFLLFNPELEGVLDDCLAGAAQETGFVDRLMAIFGGYYAFYARDRTLARAVLRELNFFSEGIEARKFLQHRARFLAAIEQQVAIGIAAGELSDGDPALAGRLIFAIYAWEIRRWLASEAASVARGLDDLRALLSLQARGFMAHSLPDTKDTAP